jgi:outer membrane protein OmpA-like peptidoglycan-associated protein
MFSILSSLFLSVAMANDLDIGYDAVISKGMSPTLYITPSADIKEIKVGIDANGKHYDFVKTGEPAGQEMAFSWKADPKATMVNAEIYAVFTDGYVAEAVMPMEFSYGAGLTVDYSSVKADRSKEEISVRVSQKVETAEIIAYGAEKKVLDEKTIDIYGGPGVITLPWLGGVRDTVLIDVTLRNSDSFAGFTYSPWYLDIPHQDVLFESNAYGIAESEEWKLESTLKDLQEVLRKYGSVVPVKLYIAGCTDTVGDSAHNKKLSNQRAKAIADWLRGHGYDAPIYYYGFGESLLAVKTGDGVDESANRRVLYIVTSDVPPDMPNVSWNQR